MPIRDNLVVGKPDIDPERPSHVRGVHEGNQRGAYERMDGHWPNGKSTAARSTGIDPDARNPILPELMPNLSPP
jgi:hypothetical protein